MSASGATLTARRSQGATRDRERSWLPGLAVALGLLLLAFPTFPVIAFGLWWNSNTVSHNFIHRTFCRNRLAHSIFSTYLTLLLGYPHSIWEARHLAHHGGRKAGVALTSLTGQMKLELALVLALWAGLAMFFTQFLIYVYLPGFVVGMILCRVHGRFEHIKGETVSHYGTIYNFLFLNDGYHAEHHLRPNLHWTELPGTRDVNANGSRWPAVLRWIEDLHRVLRDRLSVSSHLCRLERIVLHSSFLQKFVLARHEQAFRKLLGHLPANASRIGIVGGGLFPRTALVMRRLLPRLQLVLIDCSAANLATASRILGDGIETRHEMFDAQTATDGPDCIDALIIPLALVGDRKTLYARPPAASVFVHDWIWNRRGKSAIVSFFLLKRINLVTK